VKAAAGARTRAKIALKQTYGRATDAQGYVDWPQANLIDGVRLEQFERDLREGDGNELRVKFCAVHSSAALAVNCFAPFKDRPQDLSLLGAQGATAIRFEKRMQIIPGRRPSNLDVWIERTSSAVGVESKLLEYFEPTKPEFAEAYKAVEPDSEPCWWDVYEAARHGTAQHLDVAQLVKHYFGLRRFQAAASEPLKLTLLYLFWEPSNWQDVAECVRHRQEVEALARQVERSSIEFRWMTYPSLWREWVSIPHLARHARNLQARYEVLI
jgi:hypothetical protein